MQSNIQKTTLYFDKDFYLEVKKAALEEGKTITQLITDHVAENLKLTVKPRKKHSQSRVFPGFNLGKDNHKWTREEIYDFI